MKILVCCILKMENKYLSEWLTHYKKINVDKIVIYDNNDDSGVNCEHIEDLSIVKEGIDCSWIDVYKIPNKICAQIQSYNECYKKYSSEYDWLLFLDIDEYLHLENYNDIHDFFADKKYEPYDLIHFPWKIYDDNNLVNVVDENYSLQGRFVKEHTYAAGTHKEEEIKSAVRGHLENIEFTKNPHTITSKKLKCCDPQGVSDNGLAQKTSHVIYKTAWINHYICKTIEEYLNIKLIRKGAHTPHNENRYNLEFFFRYNKRTPEKIVYAKNFLEMHTDKVAVFSSLRNVIHAESTWSPISSTVRKKGMSNTNTAPKKYIPAPKRLFY